MGSANGSSSFFNGTVDEVRIYNRALSAAEVLALYNLTKGSGFNKTKKNRITDGLVGHWTFDGPDMAGVIAYDQTSNNNDGTLTGGPTRDAGKIGQGLEFDGSDDYVDTADQNYFSPFVNDITVSVWAKVPADATAVGSGCGGSGNYIITKGVASNWEWALENDSNSKICAISWQLDGTIHGGTDIARTMNDDTWHNYTMTIDYLNELHLYVDGVRVGTDSTFSGVMGNGTQAVQIGRRGDGNNFEGKIDEVRIYNRVLTAQEINALYQMGR